MKTSLRFNISAFFFVVFSNLILLNQVNGQSASNYPSLVFANPVLIAGTNLQVNAVYKFPNVIAGIDAHVTIMGMTGGAWLSEIDNTTGAGYYDAFQPYVGAGANDTSYIDWKFVFKKAGTSIDTIFPLLSITGVDVDGDGSSLKEFIEASTPGSFALDQNTNLNFSFDGTRSKAISNVTNYPNIDTANKPSMFQMNFTNINTILYRNGAITTGGSQVRQTSIYFKAFFDNQIPLPVTLLKFDVKPNDQFISIDWISEGENDLERYIVQKSFDGTDWKNVSHSKPLHLTNAIAYAAKDTLKTRVPVFYRLAMEYNGGYWESSRVIRITFPDNSSSPISNVRCTGSEINMNINSRANDIYRFDLYSLAGNKITSHSCNITAGNNRYSFNVPATTKGAYILVVGDKNGEILFSKTIGIL